MEGVDRMGGEGFGLPSFYGWDGRDGRWEHDPTPASPMTSLGGCGRVFR